MITGKTNLKRRSIVAGAILLVCFTLLLWLNLQVKHIQGFVELAKVNGASIIQSKPKWVEKLPASFANYYPESVESIYFKGESSKLLIKTLNRELKNTSIIQKWNQAETNKKISSNKPVLIHVFAYWAMPVSLREIMRTGQFLKRHNIDVYFADNTKYNPEISTFIKKHNSAGIPLTVFYWNGKAHKLPESYTSKDLQEYLTEIIN